ncbi:MAG: hypothetical protein LHW45_10825, partial [Candidatus Cloacimonetes bacterium]|nr:hypothetical protein [Candidatus Cloacimonadota bacterium]MDY0368102.1 hypothetical protein [Candidatus Syntrophosphaera sp.]
SMESGALYVLDLFLYGEDASAYLGTPATSLSAAALVIYGVQSYEGTGKITPGTGIVMIYADAEFGKAVSGTDIIGGSVASEAKKMVFMIGDDVYVTEYSNSGNAVLVVPQIDGYSFVGWYKNPDQTEIFSANNHAVFGDIFESYGFIEVATFQVTFQYAEGVEYYVDGSLVSGPVYLSVGAHSFTVKVLDGYSGTPVAKTSGSVSVASGTLTVSGDGQITGVTGVTKDQPAAAGMSLTDILMIVLVIVVVILAIVVVMRLMRS